MEITYHPMTIADYDAVLALWQGVDGVGLHLAEADSRDGIAAYLRRNPGMSLVVRDGARVVGAVLCGHDGRRGFLNHLAVRAEYRGRGIGRELVDRCFAALRAEGIVKCTIMVYADNADGQAFWERLGWDTRHDLHCMQCMTENMAASGNGECIYG